MSKKRVLLAGGAVLGVVALGAAYLSVDDVTSGAAKKVVQEWEQSLPEGRSFTYASLSASAGGTVTFEDPVYTTDQDGAQVEFRADRMVASGFSVDSGTVREIGNVEWDNGRIRAANTGDTLTTGSGSLSDLVIAADGTPRRIGGGVVSDFDMAADGSELRIAEMTLEGTEDHVYDVEIADLSVANAKSRSRGQMFDRVDVGSFSASGLALGPLDALAEKARQDGVDGEFAIDRKVDGEVSLRDMKVFSGDREIGHLGELDAVYGPEGDSGYVVDLTFTDNGARFPEQSARMSGFHDILFAQLRDMGYDSLSSSGRYAVYFDQANGVFEIRNFDIQIDDMAAFEMSAAFSGLPKVDRDAVEDRPQALMMEASQGRLDSFRVRFDDDSIVNRLIEKGAEQRGMSVDQYRQQSVQQVRQMAQMQGMPQVGEKLATFFQNPQSLEIVADPQTPLRLQELAQFGMRSPQQVMDRTGLEITVNQ